MFEAAEAGRKLSKSLYKEALPELREQLLEAQFALAETNSPVIIILEGIDNTIKGEVVNRLNEWLDTRFLKVIAFGPKTEEERERPRFWRYWRTLPSRGRIGIFSGSWYTGVLYQLTHGQISRTDFDLHMTRINNLETMIARDNGLIIKFWLHVSEKDQTERFKKLTSDKQTRWKVSALDQDLHKQYDQFIQAAERTIRKTDADVAPWIIVESTDPYHRDMTIGKTILTAMQQRLTKTGLVTESIVPVKIQRPEGEASNRTILDRVDLSQTLESKEYKKQLAHYQARLNELSWKAYHDQRTIVMVFEGWDAAGKGGAIRRITQSIDARITEVISVAAPTDEERAQHYLWRFWRHLPRDGHVTIYDRSWYGRVLVERLEGFASEADWRQAYYEINDFEDQLSDHGVILLKFWVHIDKDEQMQRFKLREETPFKRHKLTEEDWRNREKWNDYEVAVNEMVARTSSSHAPWSLIAGNCKRNSRIEILKTVCERLEKELKGGDGDKGDKSDK